MAFMATLVPVVAVITMANCAGNAALTGKALKPGTMSPPMRHVRKPSYTSTW